MTDVKSKEGNEYRNNLTIYVAKDNNNLENCVNGHLVSNHNYTLVINGNLSIRQMIDVNLVCFPSPVGNRLCRQHAVLPE